MKATPQPILCPECDSIIPEGSEGFVPCLECKTPLLITKKNGTLLVDSVEKPPTHNYNPPLNRGKIRKITYLSGKKPQAPVVDPNADEVIDSLCCMYCKADLRSTCGSLRCRMLKGQSKQVTTQWIDGEMVEFFKVYPTYKTGRLCTTCQKTLYVVLDAYVGSDGKLSCTPTQYNQYEILQELQAPRRKKIVTAGDIKMEDIGLENEKAFHHSYIPTSIGVRIIIPPPIVDEELDVSAFRKYGFSRRGGMRNYDREVNFDNQKKGR